MRKRLLRILAILILAVWSGSIGASFNDPVRFTIKAYKIDSFSDEPPDVRVIITDALSNHLEIHEQGGEIDLSEELGSLLGTTPSIDDFESNVIFSYRVEGNRAGNYTLGFSLSRFNVDPETASDGGETTRTNEYVDAYYELENNTLVFATSETTGGTLSPITITKKSGGTSNSTDPVGLSVTWSTANDGAQAMSPWIARGAVGTVISSVDLQSAKYGVYRATVMVTLTST